MEQGTSRARQILVETTRGSEYENRLFLVGGYVRDKELGLEVQEDLDIVLEGDALKLAEFLYEKGASEHVPVTYPRFGTAMVHIDGSRVEFVTARSESYHHEHRKPDVRPATLRDDALRRDFTINTLMENLHTGEIIDPLGTARDDLQAKRIRTPLDPDLTFSDDPLRMLRAVRFATKLRFDLEPTCLDAIIRQVDRLSIISAERIRDEMLKLLSYPNCSTGLQMLLDIGLLKQFAPELARMSGVTQNEYHIYDVWQHTLAALDALDPSAEPLTRFALLLHDVGKPDTRSVGEDGRVHFYQHELIGADIARNLLHRLKLSNDQIEHVARMVRNHMRPGGFNSSWSEAAVRRLVRDTGHYWEPLLQLCRADSAARRDDLPTPDFEALTERVNAVRAKLDMQNATSPLTGEEIMRYVGLPAGPEVGSLKNALTEAVVDGALEPGDKEGAYRMLDELAEGIGNRSETD